MTGTISKHEVTFYAGYGTLRQIRWSGYLPIVPRVGDEVAIGDRVYDVDKVRHLLPTKKGGTQQIEVTIR